jgi:type II secretory pathway pseudopilin PulG
MALAGLALSVVAILIAAGAFVRTSLVASQTASLASSKADKANAAAMATQRRAAVSFCRIADANRLGNPDFDPPTTPRGQQLAVFWGDLYSTVDCRSILATEPPATVPTGTPHPSPSPS